MDQYRRQQYLDAMGITAWQNRDESSEKNKTPANSITPVSLAETSIEESSSVQSIAETDEHKLAIWEQMRAEVDSCRACSLHTTRTNTVFADGTPLADWMFIGEAPGGEEDRQGLPFVGRAGQLLNAMLLALGMNRKQVCIANVLKCRPPGNRDPGGEEVQKCEPFLLRQVGIVQPRVIVVLGRFAAHSLLRTSEPIGKLRGRVFQFGETRIPIVVTYHPAYLLRNPSDKKKVWLDLKLAQATVNRV